MPHDPNNQKRPLPSIAIVMVAINLIATGILFLLTVDEKEPLIAPMTEVSMALRWAVIATVVGFLQFMWIRGWRSGG